jgi:hypothetical protein
MMMIVIYIDGDDAHDGDPDMLDNMHNMLISYHIINFLHVVGAYDLEVYASEKIFFTQLPEAFTRTIAGVLLLMILMVVMMMMMMNTIIVM